MPQLPDVTSFGSPRIPNPSGRVASYRPTLGSDMAQAGALAERAALIIEDTNRKQDELVAIDAANRLKQKRMGLQYSDDGWQNEREGKALGKPFVDKWQTKFTESASEIRGSLQTEQQRAIFDRHVEVENLTFQSHILSHQATETKRFNDSTDNSRIQLGYQTVAQRPNDTSLFAIEMDAIKAATERYGQRNGLPADEIKILVTKNQSAAYVARIQALMQGVPGYMEADPAAAEKLFNAVRPSLSPEAIRAIQPDVVAAGKETRIQQHGAEILKKFDYTQIDDALKAIDADPKIPAEEKKGVAAFVEHRLGVQARAADGAKKAQEEAASDEAWQLLGQSKRVPETVLARMNGKERVQLQTHQRELAKQAKSGEEVKTDWNTYIDVRTRMAAGEKVDLRPLTTKIAPTQMEQLLDIQTKAADAKQLPEVATSLQQISAVSKSMTLKGDDVGKFESAALDLFNTFQKNNKRAPNYEERRNMLDLLSTDVVTHKGVFWDTTEKPYKLPLPEREKALGLTTDKYVKGKLYRDANGNLATYLGNGKWEPK